MIRLRERWNSFNSFGEMLGREKPQSDVERMGWYIQLTNERGIDQWLLQVEERLLQPPGCQSRRLLKNWEKNKICQTMRRDWPFSIVLNCEKWTFLKRGHARGGKWKGETTNGSMREKSRSLRIGREWMLRAVRDLFIHQRKEKKGGGDSKCWLKKRSCQLSMRSLFFFLLLFAIWREVILQGIPLLPIGWFDILKLYYYHVPMYPSERFVGRPFFFCIQIGSWIKNSIWNR